MTPPGEGERRPGGSGVRRSWTSSSVPAWEWACLMCASATGHALGLDGAARALSGHLLAAHGEVSA